MRTFEDTNGRCWDAAVDAGSYGVQQLIFAARAGGELRVCELPQHNRFEAEQHLSGLSEPELQRLLAQAPRWQPQSDQ
jgi:hypothetical protein